MATKNPIFEQGDALMLMWYQCKKCKTREQIWNSRPRVTPFGTDCQKCDGGMNHVDWHLDVFAPNHVPKTGDLIFIDWSREAAEKHESKKIEKYWDYGEYPMNKMFETKKEALHGLMKEWRFGEPTMIKVQERTDTAFVAEKLMASTDKASSKEG